MTPSALEPEQVLKTLKESRRHLAWEPLPADERAPIRLTEQSRSRPYLQFLHGHWALPDTFTPSQPVSGPRGKLIGLFGRLTYRVLGSYLREERELLANMVRANDALEKRCDELATCCEQLHEAMISRQNAEAANLTELAIWLGSDGAPPADGTAGLNNVHRSPGDRSSERSTDQSSS